MAKTNAKMPRFRPNVNEPLNNQRDQIWRNSKKNCNNILGLFTIWQEFNASLAQLECCLTNIAKIIQPSGHTATNLNGEARFLFQSPCSSLS